MAMADWFEFKIGDFVIAEHDNSYGVITKIEDEEVPSIHSYKYHLWSGQRWSSTQAHHDLVLYYPGWRDEKGGHGIWSSEQWFQRAVFTIASYQLHRDLGTL